MPIKIPDGLPAKDILISERVGVMDETTAVRQDIRPLRIALLNLMPDKITTETQIARVLGTSPLQIELTLLRTGSYMGKNTSENHLLGFYKTYKDVETHHYDGIIITGAPVEHMDFEDVEYWSELTAFFDWAKTHSFSQFFICWGAQAALHHFHGIKKTLHTDKIFGVYPHKRKTYTHPITRGFDDIVNIPVSRFTESDASDMVNCAMLEPLLTSDTLGSALLCDNAARQVFMFNHLEYDRETLQNEFKRDQERGLNTPPPENFDGTMNWRAHRNLLFMNWINLVYQGTPYDLNDLKNPIKLPDWN